MVIFFWYCKLLPGCMTHVVPVLRWGMTVSMPVSSGKQPTKSRKWNTTSCLYCLHLLIVLIYFIEGTDWGLKCNDLSIYCLQGDWVTFNITNIFQFTGFFFFFFEIAILFVSLNIGRLLKIYHQSQHTDWKDMYTVWYTSIAIMWQ